MTNGGWTPTADFQTAADRVIVKTRDDAMRERDERVRSGTARAAARGVMGGPVLTLQKDAAADALRRFGSTALKDLIALVQSVYGSMPAGSTQWIRAELAKHIERSENGLNTYLTEQCARARIPAAERSMREAVARARIEVLREAEIALAPFDLRRAEGTEHIFDAKASMKHTTIYNVTGTQARVNVNSTDASTNIVNIDARTLFAEMRERAAQIEERCAVS